MRLAQTIRWGLALAGCLIIGAATITQTSAATPPQPWAPSGSSSQPLPPPVGIPAIQPHTIAGSAAKFTAADVTQYVNTYGVGIRAPGGASPQVVSVDFITAAEASQRMQGEYIGRPDASLVCYVQVHGDFIVLGPYTGSGPSIIHDTVLVFDTQTGNLLIG